MTLTGSRENPNGRVFIARSIRPSSPNGSLSGVDGLRQDGQNAHVPSLTPEALATLEARHLAFLEARLVSPAAEAEWRANAPLVFADLLALKVADIADPASIAAAIDGLVAAQIIDRAARPIGLHVLPIVLRELAAEPGRVGDHVPGATRAKIEALLARPAALPDRVLRELADQEAVQQVMRDVLYDGLKEFSEKVNPFIAEWGIPSLLKRMSVFGGAMTKGLESVRAELDKRMEPEIQRFLTTFTKKGLRRMVDALVSRGNEPSSIALRKHMLAWVLEQEIASLMKDVDAASIALGQEIVMDLIAEGLSREDQRARRRRLLEEAISLAKDKTVAEVLTDLGVTIEPDLEALATATWPLAKAILGGPAVMGWLRALVHEFYAEAAKAD